MSKSPRFYFKEMRLQQFRSLVALAQWQSFSAAAAALGVTRAAVWQQIRSMEQELATTLVRPSGHRVTLTADGLKLAQMVAPLVAGFDSVKAAFLSSQDSVRQTLVVAAAATFIVYELAEPIMRIHTAYPQMSLSFLERTSPTAIEILEQGGADVAVGAWPEHLQKRPTLEYLPIRPYPFMLICPPNHPLLTKKKLTLADFTRHPLILPGVGAYCRQQFNAVLTRAGLLSKVDIVLESTFPLVHFEYVRVGMGVAVDPLPPELSIPLEYRKAGLALRPVVNLFGNEQIYYMRRKGEFEKPHAARFRELVLGQRIGRPTQPPPLRERAMPGSG